MPALYIITGANGAGKSTFGFSYLPTALQHNYTIFDGDKLFLLKRRELYPSHTPSLKEAKRLANEWLHEFFEENVVTAIAEQKNFIYEGHFPDDDNWATPERFKKAGYTINFIFLGLDDISLSALRVFERAQLGGHNVPPFEIERNFYGNLYQLNKRFAIIDVLRIIDSSHNAAPIVLTIFNKGTVEFSVHHGKLPEWFEKFLPNLFEKIIEQEVQAISKENK